MMRNKSNLARQERELNGGGCTIAFPRNKIGRHRGLLFKEQKRKCAFCGRFCKAIGKSSDYNLFTVEHIYPRRFGGKDDVDNLIGACYRCNNHRAREILVADNPERFKEVRLREVEMFRMRRAK